MSKYECGWSDYVAEHGRPNVEWELIESDRNYDAEELIACIGMATGVSMIVAPVAWVGLLLGVLA